MTLSPSQRIVLDMMLSQSGFSYSEEDDRTLLALKRRGLVGYSRGGKYGKSHWTLTEAGEAEAKKRRRGHAQPS